MSAVNGIQLTPSVDPGSGGGIGRQGGSGSGFGEMMAEASPQEAGSSSAAGGNTLQGDGDALPSVADQGASTTAEADTGAATTTGTGQDATAATGSASPPPQVADGAAGESGASELFTAPDANPGPQLPITPVAVPTALRSDGAAAGSTMPFSPVPHQGATLLQASLVPAKPGSTSLPPGGSLFLGPGAGLSLALDPQQSVKVPEVAVRPGVLNEPALDFSARFEAVPRPGADKLPLDIMLPDALLSRGGEGVLAGQGAAGNTSALSAALFGGLDASGELQLQSAQRADLSSQLLQRAADRSWNGEFAGRLTTMVKNGVQEASLQLNPAELGRMEVQIATDGDQTRVQFLVQNAAAREAVEQAMPRLRDMLEQSGLQLAHSDVADQSQSQDQQRGFVQEETGNAREPSAVDGPADTSVAVQQLTGGGLIDHYA